MDAKIRREICLVLADQAQHVPWKAFTPQDWVMFVAAARAERVAPLVYWKLEQAYGAGMPLGSVCDQIAAAIQQLRNDYYQNCAHNLALYLELSGVLRQLQDKHIPVVLLKGISLTATVYPDIALRPMGDIDILVRQPDVELTVQALAALRYKKLIMITPWYEQVAGYHCHLINEADRVVEVHWNLIGNPRNQLSPPVDWFWSQAIPWEAYIRRGAFQPQPEVREVFARYQPRLLSPEACLLYLAAHLKIQHRTDGELLFWQYDLHQVVSIFKDSLDWGLVIRTAVSFNWLVILAEALLEIKVNFGTALPVEVDTIINAVEDNTRGRPVHRSASRIQKQLSRTHNMPLWVQAMVLFAYIIPGRDYMLRHYRPNPAWAWPVYYFYRWADIFVEGLRTLVNLALRDIHR